MAANANAVHDPEVIDEVKQENSQSNGIKHLPALCLSADDFLQYNYDFLIVGGGTAGLTVAARLTEDPNVTVGVIEGGKNRLDDALVDCPATFLQMLGHPDYDWRFMSVPLPGFERLGGSVRHQFVRGKMLGGSSGINYMLYVRGSDRDYDDWATITGDEAWNWKHMKQYFRKHQTIEPADPASKTETTAIIEKSHGKTGPIHTGFNDYGMRIEDAYIQSCNHVVGINRKPIDVYDGDHFGFNNILGTVYRSGPHKGKRSYAARGYFEPNAARPNLHVLCEALVHKVELNGDLATGVLFEHAGQVHTVSATKEVIVSGGSIQTPQILELSGIGDPAILSKAGVQCKMENEGVGRNFMDHSVTVFEWRLQKGWESLDHMHQPERLAEAQKQMVEEQGGPLTGVSSAQGFFSYKPFATESEQKDILEAIRQYPGDTPFQQKVYKTISRTVDDERSANLQLVCIPVGVDWTEGPGDQAKIFKPPEDPYGPACCCATLCLQYPFSRGHVHITSADPHEHPEIDPAFFRHPADMGMLAAGVKMAERVGTEGPFGKAVDHRIYPPRDWDLSDVEMRKKTIMNWHASEYHSCGSCAMGDALDSRLKVKGVKNLRVVDASIFPAHVSGNIQSTVYAVAEKAADLIKEEHKLRTS